MEKIVLDNGFRILLETVPWARSATMGVWIGSGSRFETPEDSGASHFIEHMLFKGTHSRSALDIAEQMDAIGGALNAYTAKEYTCIYARALDYHVTTAFPIIADMLTDPRFDEEDIETEKGVILEEISMYEDSPEDVCIDALYAGVWPDDMLGANILGTRETVSNMTAAQLGRYMSRQYAPQRMVAAFSGSFDRAEILALCETYFGNMKYTGAPLRPDPAIYTPCIRLTPKDFEQTQLALGFPGIPMCDDRRFAMQILNAVLGASSSSRLYQRIREERGLVYAIDSFSAAHLESGLFGVTMAVSPNAEEEALLETFRIMHEICDGVTDREVARAKEQYASSLIMGLESTASRAAQMGRCELLTDAIDSEDELIERIRCVTSEEVRQLAQDFLDPSGLALSTTGRVHERGFYEEILAKARSII